MYYLDISTNGSVESCELEDAAALVAELRRRGLNHAERDALYDECYLRVDFPAEGKVVRYVLDSDGESMVPNAGSAS